MYTCKESTVVCSGEIDVVELYHAFPPAIAATMRAQGSRLVVWAETYQTFKANKEI